MQRNNTPILIGTILFGLLALGATVMLLFRAPGPPSGEPTPGAPVPTPTPISQIKALIDIPPRTAITEAMIERGPVDSTKVPVGAITSISDVRDMITNEPIRRGEVIAMSSFTPRLKRVVDANIEIPLGFRAVAIYVEPDSTAAGLVDAGDKVDVIANHRLTWDKGPNQFIVGSAAYTTGRSIAQNLLVLAVDKSINRPKPTPVPAPAAVGPDGQPVAPAPAAPAPAEPPPPPPGTPPAKIRVLLAAPPALASRLVAANDQGMLHVVIRNPLDDDAAPSAPAQEFPSRLITIKPEEPKAAKAPQVPNFGELFKPTKVPQQPPMPLPGPQLPAPAPTAAEKDVTVIRGTEKTRVIVPQ